VIGGVLPFLPPAWSERFYGLKYLPPWHWYIWIIGILVIAVVGVFEGGHRQVVELEVANSSTALKAESPELFLEYSPEDAADFIHRSGLFVRNCGKKQAFRINLRSDPEKMRKVRLRFDDMPIQKIDPDKRALVKLSTEHLADNGIWHPIGGSRGGQIEHCFERLSEAGEGKRIPVTIEYSDYEGKSYTTPCVILRDDTLGA
jgi:hypothetical protein